MRVDITNDNWVEILIMSGVPELKINQRKELLLRLAKTDHNIIIVK